MAATLDIHPFERAGLGIAPFRCTGVEEKVYGPCNQPAGTCDYCGNGIKYVYHVRSSDGKEFGVGCDCIRKVDRECLLDSALKVKAAADRKAREEKRWAAYDRQLAAQRERNGGKTDAEIAHEQWLAAEEARKAAEEKIADDNAWVIRHLEAYGTNGDFVPSMVFELKRRPLVTLSERSLKIVAKIWASMESGKRAGSNAHDAALEVFWAKVENNQ